MALAAELSLAELQVEFAQWRVTRSSRQVPTPLRMNAVALLGRHSTSEILKTLKINHQMLTRWRRRYGDEPKATATPSSSAFVPLSAGHEVTPPSSERFDSRLKITRQTADGTALSVEGKLTLAQWRVAMTLLTPAGVGQ